MAVPAKKKPVGSKPPKKITLSVPAKNTGGAMARVKAEKAKAAAYNKRTGADKQAKAYNKAMKKGSANIPGFTFGRDTI